MRSAGRPALSPSTRYRLPPPGPRESPTWYDPGGPPPAQQHVPVDVGMVVGLGEGEDAGGGIGQATDIRSPEETDHGGFAAAPSE